MSKESFKSFARGHTELANYVMNGKTSWQRLYELYEIYGENSSIWKDYFSSTSSSSLSSATQGSDLSGTLRELMQNIKNIDLNSVQKGITNIQKALGLLQDIGIGHGNGSGSGSGDTTNYEPRPLYQHFDD